MTARKESPGLVRLRPFHPSMDSWAAKAGVEPPLALSRIGTALEYRPDMSEGLGRDVFLKREDTSDDIGCGHKLRKLSFHIPEVLKGGATMLVTAGSAPSNQCKAVARAARYCGLKAHAVYLGDHQQKPAIAQGNYLLTSLLDQRITWYEHTAWASADVLVDAIVAEEAARGERPVVIASGVSQGPGLLGSVEMGYEIDDAIDGVDHEHLAIVAVAGSGGTCLGVKLAAEKLGRRWRVFGCCIGESEDTVRNRVSMFRREFHARFGWGREDDGRLVFLSDTIGDGYDRPRSSEMEAVGRVLRDYGLIFDVNYMIKAYLGLERLLKSAAFDGVRQVVLVHSGGQIGLFDGNPIFSAWHRARLANWVC